MLKKENVIKELQASLEVFIYQESEPGMIYLWVLLLFYCYTRGRILPLKIKSGIDVSDPRNFSRYSVTVGWRSFPPLKKNSEMCNFCGISIKKKGYGYYREMQSYYFQSTTSPDILRKCELLISKRFYVFSVRNSLACFLDSVLFPRK